MTRLNIGSKSFAGTFSYYQDGSNSPVVRYVYPYDLNGDGVDEILFAGFETQPNTPSNYSNTSIHLFGWVDGKLKEITSSWLTGNNSIVEGVGDVCFGDFNGDGLIDIFLSAYTDMEHPANVYVLMNQGGSFEKINLGSALWQHGIAVADINRDGFSDVFASGYDAPTIYIGGPNGLMPRIIGDVPGTPGAGSGIALADFLGDGSISAITVDTWINGSSDTGLFSIDDDFNVRLYSALPPSRFGENGHDIRVKAFDFSGDGLSDAVVFSRYSGDALNGGWPEKSEVQFLLNQGGGVFTDVTDSVRFGYNTETNVSYNPIFRDFNQDGKTDIFLSESSWSTPHDSTTILLQSSAGQFVDFGRQKLSALIDKNGGISNIALGPDQKFYLVGEQYSSSPDGLKTSVYAIPISFHDDATDEVVKAVWSGLEFSLYQNTRGAVVVGNVGLGVGHQFTGIALQNKAGKNYTIKGNLVDVLVYQDDSLGLLFKNGNNWSHQAFDQLGIQSGSSSKISIHQLLDLETQFNRDLNLDDWVGDVVTDVYVNGDHSGEYGLYKTISNSYVIDVPDLMNREVTVNPIVLKASSTKLASFKTNPIALLVDDDFFGIVTASGHGEKRVFTQHNYTESGILTGKSIKLTNKMLYEAEDTYQEDINDDGAIGDIIKTDLDVGDYIGSTNLDLYKTASGGYLLDSADLSIDDSATVDGILLNAAVNKPWSIKSTVSILGIAEKNSGNIEVLLKTGNNYTAQTLDVETGLMSKVTKLKTIDILAREYYYNKDLNGDNVIELIGDTPPSGWDL